MRVSVCVFFEDQYVWAKAQVLANPKTPFGGMQVCVCVRVVCVCVGVRACVYVYKYVYVCVCVLHPYF